MSAFQLMKKVTFIPRTSNPNAAEYRDQLAVFAQADRSGESPAQEFVPSADKIHERVKQAGAIECELSISDVASCPELQSKFHDAFSRY